MSSPEAKNIPLLALLKSTLKIRRLVSQKGGSRSSRTRGGMRWTQAALLTRARACGRRSRVVLTPRRWRQVGGAIYRRRWQQSPVTEESAKETVKTIARGKPDVSGEPVVTNARVYYPPRAATGASDTRLSLRPLDSEGTGSCITRAFRAAIVHLSCPDLIRASIPSSQKVLSKRMDCRVKPGNDDFICVACLAV